MGPRYLVTGHEGQVVRSLMARRERYPQIEVSPLGRPTLDLAQISEIEASILGAKPDLIISAAAYTAVDQAETDEVNAFAVNAVAVGEIGRVAKNSVFQSYIYRLIMFSMGRKPRLISKAIPLIHSVSTVGQSWRESVVWRRPAPTM